MTVQGLPERLAARLARGRAMAESLMTDTCRIRKRTGETTDAAGRVTPTYVTVYEGRCRFQARGLTGESARAGEQTVDVLRLELQVPVSVTGVRTNHEVVCLTSVDPELVGRVMRVAQEFVKTHATARRFPLEEGTS